GQRLMSLAKVIIVLDKDVNVRDPKEAWWVALNHIDPERDVRFSLGPIDVLDHSSRGFTFGSKMGIDATRKWKEEGFTREWPNRIVMDPATKQKVDGMWKELGRELPTGRLTLAQAWIAVALAAALFLGTARALNPLCFALAPIALVFISAYSYTKRFTAWSHLWLGLADGIATPAGYLAVTGRWSEPWWLLPVGALAVTLWVGGFDVFYALPDE